MTIVNDLGAEVAREAPQDLDALEAQGLRLDPEAGPSRKRVELELPNGERVTYQVIVSDLYSNREATLEQIRSALIGAGVLALGASLVTGIIAARSLTVPIARLRRVAGRVAQGQLDERAARSGVLEIDELGQQFNVMADRLSGTLRHVEADRDRLREFVADVSHELRTPIAALRMYTELQRDGEVDEATRQGVPGPVARPDPASRLAQHEPARPLADRRRHLSARHARSEICATRCRRSSRR